MEEVLAVFNFYSSYNINMGNLLEPQDFNIRNFKE